MRLKVSSFNISILEADISKQFLKFDYFFKPEDCINKDEESISLYINLVVVLLYLMMKTCSFL